MRGIARKVGILGSLNLGLQRVQSSCQEVGKLRSSKKGKLANLSQLIWRVSILAGISRMTGAIMPVKCTKASHAATRPMNRLASRSNTCMFPRKKNIIRPSTAGRSMTISGISTSTISRPKTLIRHPAIKSRGRRIFTSSIGRSCSAPGMIKIAYL